MSILPLLSKVFQRLIYDQLSEYLEKFPDSLLRRFRKTHSNQCVLFKLYQAWQEELDKSGDQITLWEQSQWISHMSMAVCQMNYSSIRKQRTKISLLYSNWYGTVVFRFIIFHLVY